MYLLRLRAKKLDILLLVEDENLEAAKVRGRAFVGEHHSSDGCSTVPYERDYPTRMWAISRSSSFGERSAHIYPPTLDLGEPANAGRNRWDIG